MKGSENNQLQEKDDLLEEFEELIKVVSLEVSGTVLKSTVLKEIQELNRKMSDFRSELPKSVQSVNGISQVFQSAKKDVQETSAMIARNTKEQDESFRKNLAAISQKYEQLSESSFKAFAKSMDSQSSEIVTAVGVNCQAMLNQKEIVLVANLRDIKAKQENDFQLIKREVEGMQQLISQEASAIRSMISVRMDEVKNSINFQATQDSELLRKKMAIQTRFLWANTGIAVIALSLFFGLEGPTIIRKCMSLSLLLR